MKKQHKTQSRLLEIAYAIACGLFNYGGVIIATLIEACTITLTVCNIAKATEFNAILLIAGIAINILTACLLGSSIKEAMEAKKSTQL